MDTSKEYVLMCEKAEKYLPKWTHKDIDDWDYFQCKYTEPDNELINANHIFCGLDMEAWTRIYRQDQLQDMLINLPQHQNRVMKPTFGLIEGFNHYIWYQNEYEYESMEQLWLAFVMKEKYNKTWNGKDWIKGK